MEDELRGLVSNNNTALADRLDNFLLKVKSRISPDDIILEDVHINQSFLESFHFETLNEAQNKKCVNCYLHSLLNEKALTPKDLYATMTEQYSQDYYRFVLLYKLTDSIKIYHAWVGMEDDYNETKMVMMVAYIIGIGCSAAMTVWMFDRFFKKQAKQKKIDDYEAEEQAARDCVIDGGNMDQKQQDKLLRQKIYDILGEDEIDPAVLEKIKKLK